MGSVLMVTLLANLIGTWVLPANAWKDGCPFDYTPCQCSVSVGYNLECTNVIAEEIQSIFRQPNITDIYSLTLRGNFPLLPSYLTADKSVQKIYFNCDKSRLQEIHIDAFRSSENVTTDLSFDSCDLTSLDLYFLTNFTVLKNLAISSGPLITLRAIPYLPSLSKLELTDCLSFREWHSPTQTPNLSYIYLSYLETEFVIDEILNALTYYKQTLKQLRLWGVGLTRFPPQIQFLDQLELIYLKYDNISILTNGSVAIGPNLKSLLIESSGVHIIEPGAFQGDLGSVYISLYSNKLKQFEEAAFIEVLRSMINSTGSIGIQINPFDCDCGLAWLIRDNRELLPKVRNGYCFSGTRFEQLDQNGFTGCRAD